jgi:hypothetical protein
MATQPCPVIRQEWAPRYRQPTGDRVDSGRGDVPLKDLKFRCTKCGSSLTDHVVMSRDALAVQPWRREAG